MLNTTDQSSSLQNCDYFALKDQKKFLPLHVSELMLYFIACGLFDLIFFLPFIVLHCVLLQTYCCFIINCLI